MEGASQSPRLRWMICPILSKRRSALALMRAQPFAKGPLNASIGDLHRALPDSLCDSFNVTSRTLRATWNERFGNMKGSHCDLVAWRHRACPGTSAGQPMPSLIALSKDSDNCHAPELLDCSLNWQFWISTCPWHFQKAFSCACEYWPASAGFFHAPTVWRITCVRPAKLTIEVVVLDSHQPKMFSCGHFLYSLKISPLRRAF